MSAEDLTIRVNFGRPMPLLPISGCVVLPHAKVQLIGSDESVRKLLNDAIDGSGQVAVALFESDSEPSAARSPVRSGVCIAHIGRHHSSPDGRIGVLLVGVCRARVLQELPADESRGYRAAYVEPVGLEPEESPELERLRDSIREALEVEPLSDLLMAAGVVDHLSKPEVPTSAVLDVLAWHFINAVESKYRFLAEADPAKRARVIERELASLSRTLRKAAPQRQLAEPKGCCWN